MVMTYFDLLGWTKMEQSIELGIELTNKVINGVWCQIRWIFMGHYIYIYDDADDDDDDDGDDE